ncbi:MAG TPA: lipid-binding SYLF domain-containing protein [Candidatus Angelobacter sp.]|nr:lipid-binding SYLF domain-containing protein [Candidatus Angelobacter sp.]
MKKLFLVMTFLALLSLCVAGAQTGSSQNTPAGTDTTQDKTKATKAERDAEDRADKNAGSDQESIKAADNSKAAERAASAATALSEIMNVPEKGVPGDILAGAKCVIMLPSVKKAGFIVGGRYGRGYASCRTSNGWSAPAPVFLGGGSYGAQIGAEGVDLLLVVMNDKGVQHLLSSKFEIGVDASAAAGPVGRSASAGTNWKLDTEILSYSRAKGLFAGIELNGAKVRQDDDTTKQLYGNVVPFRDILSGTVPTPRAARVFVSEVQKDFREATAQK